MESLIVTVIMGIFIIAFGIINLMGDISSLHWYHRMRITEENRIPFGKKIGTGMIIVGISLIVCGISYYAAEKLQAIFLQTLGTVILVSGIVVGFSIIIYAIIKYNKGVF